VPLERYAIAQLVHDRDAGDRRHGYAARVSEHAAPPAPRAAAA
jgi:hypothetical protein